MTIKTAIDTFVDNLEDDDLEYLCHSAQVALIERDIAKGYKFDYNSFYNDINTVLNELDQSSECEFDENR